MNEFNKTFGNNSHVLLECKSQKLVDEKIYLLAKFKMLDKDSRRLFLAILQILQARG